MKEGAKQILRLAGLSKYVQLIEDGICPTCRKPIERSSFKDEITKGVFEQTGMCIECQQKK